MGLGLEHRPSDRQSHSPRCGWCVWLYMCVPESTFPFQKEASRLSSCSAGINILKLPIKVESPGSQVMNMLCLAPPFHLAEPQEEDSEANQTQSSRGLNVNVLQVLGSGKQ